jgi:hypothetical protein
MLTAAGRGGGQQRPARQCKPGWSVADTLSQASSGNPRLFGSKANSTLEFHIDIT